MERNGIPKNAVLEQYIQDGMVDYQRLAKDPWIHQQIEVIERRELEGLSRDQLLAFWLNAYNFTTIKSVLKRLAREPDWQGVISALDKFRFFVWHRHQIAGRKMSLYYLENRIIRKFGDPRIHFAINCASHSCPFLPAKKFEANNLNDYLEDLTFDFVNYQQGVRIEDNNVVLSKIFSMYKRDFGQDDEEMLAFVKRYWKGEWPASAQISYQLYDWHLNSS